MGTELLLVLITAPSGDVAPIVFAKATTNCSKSLFTGFHMFHRSVCYQKLATACMYPQSPNCFSYTLMTAFTSHAALANTNAMYCDASKDGQRWSTTG